MTLSRIVPRAALGALTFGAVLTLAAPLLPLAREAQAEEEREETTITISTSKDREATVLKLGPMRPGETKTVTSESGKPVTVTRTDDGYRVKTGDREIRVKTSPDGEGPHVLLPGGKEVHVIRAGDGGGTNMVFTGDDGKEVAVRKGAFVYRIGDGGAKASAADVLAKAAPKSLESLDRRTRGAVEQVLQELIESGAVFAPRMPMTWNEKDGAGGEQVKVLVVREKGLEGGK